MKHNTSCDSCDSCNYCSSCINLKMTEYNYFCYSKSFNDENSFQQRRYRVFNKQLTEGEYSRIEKVEIKLKFDSKENYKTRYKTAFSKAWDKLSQEHKDKITNLPGFNKQDFHKFYGVEIQEKPSSTLEQIKDKIGDFNLITK